MNIRETPPTVDALCALGKHYIPEAVKLARREAQLARHNEQRCQCENSTCACEAQCQSVETRPATVQYLYGSPMCGQCIYTYHTAGYGA